MKSNQLATSLLAASAFVLAGLLAFVIQERLPVAQAALTVTKGDITLTAARSTNGQDSLYVIDNKTNRLLIFTLNYQRKQMDLISQTDLSKVFGAPGGGPGGPTVPRPF